MKTSVVSGASYGLGKSISEMLLSESYRVYGISRTDPKIENKNFVWIKSDLLDEKSFDLINSSISESEIDLLINNAGTAFIEDPLKLTNESFERMFNINFKVHIKLTSKLIDKVKNGLLINISSVSDRYTGQGWGLYSASKAAMNIFFEDVADYYRQLKVVNLLPDYIDTPLQHDIREGKSFDWSLVMNPDSVAKSVKYIIENSNKIPNCSKVIVVNDKLLEDTEDPEKLYYYNIDTEEFKKLK